MARAIRSSAHIRQVLEPGNGRLRAERGTVGQLIERELEDGIVPEAFGVGLNLVECWFALLSRRRLQRGAFASTDDLEAAILAYIAETNADPKPFVWTKTADDILASVARFRLRTSNSGH